MLAEVPAAMRKASPYQSYPDAPGDSRTGDKLARIGLPADLTGKSLLDLGCNEGFFSIEARRRGAERVLGIDHVGSIVRAARARAEQAGVDVEFREADMFSLPDEKFDYILLLSALHYIPEPAKLLQALRRILKPQGVLILEIGVATWQAERSVGRALRSIDERFFPSPALLTNVWLRDYVVRSHGESVPQAGDPVSRLVFHCVPARTSVVFIVGKGGIGKSHLASQFASAPVISTDSLFAPVRAANPRLPAPQKNYDESVGKTGCIWTTWNAIKGDPAIRGYFAQVISKAIQHCAGAGQVVVEGFVATDLIPEIGALLGDEYNCWQTTRTAA